MATYQNDLGHAVDIPAIGKFDIEPGEQFETDETVNFPEGISTVAGGHEDPDPEA